MSPWAEISYSKPLTQAKLGSLLRDFDIHPEQIKVGGINRNGYRREQFAAVFATYFPPTHAQPPAQTSTGSTEPKDQEKIAFQSSTSEVSGRPLKEEIPHDEQSSRGGRLLKPPVYANSGDRAGEFRCDAVAVPDGYRLTTPTCAQCGGGRPDDPPTVPVTRENGDSGYVHERGCLKYWRKEHGDVQALGNGARR